MTPEALKAVNERVRQVAERIQPQLTPHAGLAKRNAHAHVWLGLKVILGEDWRECAAPASVHAVLEWMEGRPNSDYGDYRGPREELSTQERGVLF